MANNRLGVDYGLARVGLALAVGSEAPQRLATLTNNDRLLTRLQKLVAEHAVAEIVVGLPRGIEGEETRQAAITREFARQLEAAVAVPVALQDEFATTAAARQRLAEQSGSRPAPRGLADQEAAVIILEDYLHAA